MLLLETTGEKMLRAGGKVGTFCTNWRSQVRAANHIVYDRHCGSRNDIRQPFDCVYFDKQQSLIALAATPYCVGNAATCLFLRLF